MERLTLPAPARGLWAQTAAELHRLLKHLPTRAEGYGIGGGTVLAARWNHRKSTDIDLTVPEGCGLNIMTRKHSAVIRDRMKRLGSEEPLLTERHYRIEFRKGTIEITESDPRPGLGGKTVDCHGYMVKALSTTQILRGKLERSLRHEPPARDLFDMIIAERMEPKALQGAVNMLGRDAQRQVIATWRNAAYRMENEGPATIHGIGEEHERLTRNLTQYALKAFEDARYIESTVRRAGDDVLLTTRTRTGTNTIRTKVENVETTLEETGLSVYFEETEPGPADVAKRIDDAISSPGERPATLTKLAMPALQRQASEPERTNHEA